MCCDCVNHRRALGLRSEVWERSKIAWRARACGVSYACLTVEAVNGIFSHLSLGVIHSFPFREDGIGKCFNGATRSCNDHRPDLLLRLLCLHYFLDATTALQCQYFPASLMCAESITFLL